MSISGFYRIAGRSFGDTAEKWYELLPEIDQFIYHSGIELAQEEIFFYWKDFSKKDEFILGRPVISQKRTFALPFILFDFKYSSYRFFELKSTHWKNTLLEIEQLLLKDENSLSKEVALRLERNFQKDLNLKLGVYLS